MKSVYAIPLLISLLFIPFINVYAQNPKDPIPCREYVDKFTKYDQILNVPEFDWDGFLNSNEKELISALKSVSAWYQNPFESFPKKEDLIIVFEKIDSLDNYIKSTITKMNKGYTIYGECTNTIIPEAEKGEGASVSWESELIHAFASYMLERGEAELTDSFLEGLKDKIKDHDDIRFIFPRTYTLFTAEHIYPRVLIQQSQKAFQNDLLNLPVNLSNTDLVNLTSKDLQISKNTYLKEILLLTQFGIKFGYNLYNTNRGPLSLLTEEDMFEDNDLWQLEIIGLYLKDWVYKENNTIKIYRINANDSNGTSIRNKSWMEHYISLSTEYYLKKALVKKGIKDDSLQKKLAENYKVIVTQIEDLIEALYRLNGEYKEYVELKTKPNPPGLSEEEKNRIKTLQALIFSESLGMLAGPIQVYSILSDEKTEKYRIILSNIGEVVDASIQHDYRRIALSASNILSEIDMYEGNNKWVPKLVGFMGAIASADNEEEMKLAIQAFALPVGSWREKANNDVTFSLDSYVGFAANRQGLFYEREGQREYEYSYGYGCFAPVGMTWNINKTFAAMIYLLDFGRVISYHIDNEKYTFDETNNTVDYYLEENPEISFENIVNIGFTIWFRLGEWFPYVKKETPFAFGISGAIGKTPWDAVGSDNSLNGTAYQLKVGFAIDMPLMILKSKI